MRKNFFAKKIRIIEKFMQKLVFKRFFKKIFFGNNLGKGWDKTEN